LLEPSRDGATQKRQDGFEFVRHLITLGSRPDGLS
jgi:hypothetical protein